MTKKDKKKDPMNGSFHSDLGLFVSFDFQDLLAIVIAALRANTMGADGRAAMRAGDQAGDLEFEVAAAKSLRGFAGSSLWDCHVRTLLSNAGLFYADG